MKTPKMAYGHCWVLLCYHDMRYDSGKDLSYFNFPRDEQKRKRTPSLECIIYFEYNIYSHVASFQIQDGGYVIRVYGTVVTRMDTPEYGETLNLCI